MRPAPRPLPTGPPAQAEPTSATTGASFLIDAHAGALLAANAEGLQLWGVDARLLPLAIDRAMPAMRTLCALAGVDGAAAAAREMLTFWTARGMLQLHCRPQRVAAGGGAATFALLASSMSVTDALCAEPTAQERELTSDNGCTARPIEARPDLPLSAKLAHELRTPLSAVIAYAELLKDEHFGPLPNTRYQGYARDIYESARHALGVIDGMLKGDGDRPGAQQLTFRDLDPAAVVESCLAVSRPMAQRAGVLLGLNFAPYLPRIVADELSLRQMLLNLLTNAVKFARRGDQVVVTVTYDLGGALTIAVTDTGPGMLQRSASRFGETAAETTNDDGLGFGLPFTRALAEANGAAFAIESTLGEGTCARISFGKARVVPV